MAVNGAAIDSNFDEKPNLQARSNSGDELSPNLREYLFRRHGTVDLDPIPAAEDADPYNWPVWKVCECAV
jgi:hypothetical protein